MITVSQICALLASAFAGALIAYVPTARQKGWPVGDSSNMPVQRYLAFDTILLMRR